MRNKQKAWRSAAQNLNAELESKHNGKSLRHSFRNMSIGMYPLLQRLLERVKD